jgi:tetratricopeptide (TPR) repeat protein
LGIFCLAHAAPADVGFSAPVGYDYEEAKALLTSKNYTAATIMLRKVLKYTENQAPVAMDLAKALVYSGRREEALSVLTQVAGREKGERREQLIRRANVVARIFLTKSTSQSYQEGLNFLKAKRFGAAKERFEKALEFEPDNLEVLLRLGQCQVMTGDNDSAAERLRLAKRLNPHELEVRLWLGRALHQRGELSQGIEELQEAQRGLASSELTPVWLAEALHSAGQKVPAIQLLEKDAKAQPFHLMSLLTLAKFKLANAPRDAQSHWSVKKDLQVALSRLEDYGKPTSPSFESELGLDLRSPEQIKAEIQVLLQKVELRLGPPAPEAG